MSSPDILDDLRNAAARGRLLVVTGAGISKGLTRADGEFLPSWGKLVETLKEQADDKLIAPEQLRLLDELLPAGLGDKLHGDALIEASEIIQAGFKRGEFERAIAKLCRAAPGKFSPTHAAIAEIAPVGVITFNYDRAHEAAFRSCGRPCEPILYNDHAKIRALLARRGPGAPFVLKAHGCTTNPRSLVLTSSSYREVLSANRAYRMLLQHALIHYTIVIVGFALRDRDFDQLLTTLEVELGKPVRRNAFIAKEPDSTPEGIVQRADWAVVTARFAVEPIYVPDHGDIPACIRSLALEPGSLVGSLVSDAVSPDKAKRTAAHDEIGLLGPIGRQQVRAALLKAISGAMTDAELRCELIYALGSVADGKPDVAKRLMKEIRSAAREFAAAPDRWSIECAAHALLVLRRSRLPDGKERAAVLSALGNAGLLDVLREMDKWLARHGDVERLVAYALAAGAEIEARSRA